MLEALPQQLYVLRRNLKVAEFSHKAQEHLKTLLGLTKLASKRMAQQKVLSMISYEKMHTRYQTVEDAHSKTFRWPVKHNGVSLNALLDEARDRYLSWLSRGRGIFHVAGKPGSGKSTLMRFLCRHPRTKEELLKRSGQCCMLHVSHEDTYISQRALNSYLLRISFGNWYDPTEVH